MKFDESSAPEALDYDFRAWKVDAHGRVPEPTDAVLGTFLKFFDDLQETDQEARFQAEANALNAAQETPNVVIVGDMPEIEGAPEPEQNVEPEKPQRRTWREIVLGDEAKARDMADRIGDLCQQQPSGEQIWALPRRIRIKFIDCVFALFILGDESGGLSPAGTKPSPAGGNGAGSTT